MSRVQAEVLLCFLALARAYCVDKLSRLDLARSATTLEEIRNDFRRGGHAAPGDSLPEQTFVPSEVGQSPGEYAGTSEDFAMSLDEIGKALGISKERARQILNGALRRLAHPSRLGAYWDYFQ